MVGTKKACLIYGVIVGILLYGCSGETPTTPTATPVSSSTVEGGMGEEGNTAAVLLALATKAMHKAKSFQYLLVSTEYQGEQTPTAREIENPDLPLIPSDRPITEEEAEMLSKAMGPLALISGQGVYMAPDRARFEVRFVTSQAYWRPGLNVEERTIVIPGQHFEYNEGG